MRTVVRTMLSVMLLVIAYTVTPAHDISQGDAIIQLVVGVALLGGVMALQFFAVLNDPIPELRAATALLVVTVLLVLVFAMVYATMSYSAPAAFSQPIDRQSGIYFTVTILATVGFGDIAPVSTAARWVVTTQMILDLTLVVAVGRVLVMAARMGRARRNTAAANSAK